MTSPASPVVPGARNVADLVSDAVSGCADVAALSAGISGQVRSYLPGRNIPGVRISDDLLEIHIVAHYGSPLPVIAGRIGEAVRPWTVGRELVVTVEDILLPGEELEPDPVSAVAEGAEGAAEAVEGAGDAVEAVGDTVQDAGDAVAAAAADVVDDVTSDETAAAKDAEADLADAPDAPGTAESSDADTTAPETAADGRPTDEKPPAVVVLVVEPGTVVDTTTIRPTTTAETVTAAESDAQSEPAVVAEPGDQHAADPAAGDTPVADAGQGDQPVADPATRSDVQPNSPPPAH